MQGDRFSRGDRLCHVQIGLSTTQFLDRTLPEILLGLGARAEVLYGLCHHEQHRIKPFECLAQIERCHSWTSKQRHRCIDKGWGLLPLEAPYSRGSLTSPG